jgi:hypothetical protein
MTDQEIDPKDYVEFLIWKKDKLAKEFNEQMADIDKKISAHAKKVSPVTVPFIVSGVKENNDNKNGTRDTVGWKYLIDEVLKQSDRYVSARYIIDTILTKPEMEGKIEIAKKSVASALTNYSSKKIGRYLVKTEKGKKVYLLNKDYQEKTASKAV